MVFIEFFEKIIVHVMKTMNYDFMTIVHGFQKLTRNSF